MGKVRPMFDQPVTLEVHGTRLTTLVVHERNVIAVFSGGHGAWVPDGGDRMVTEMGCGAGSPRL